MTLRLAYACAFALFAAAPALAEELTIEGVGQSRDVSCDGEDVIVAGQGNSIQLSGACGVVKILGADHKVSFDSARQLVVSGAANTATGGTTGAILIKVTNNKVKATVKAPDQPATVNVSGADQQVELTLAGPVTISLQGAQNALSWSAESGVKAPKVSTSGIGNRVTRR